MKKNILFVLFLFLNLSAAGGLILNLTSCSPTDPKLEPELALKLEDVSCTEAWLQLTTNNIQMPATINLLKNNTVTQTFSLSTKDSLLYVDSLLPNQNYSFQVSSIQNPVSSNKVNAITMDTTSHNFTFETFTFGQHSSSILYDVAIINENDIWAVGEIYMNDSLGNPDPTCYNAVHWNGQSWELLRIPYYYNGQNFYTGIRAIYAFNQNDVWFGIASLIHWNGSAFQSVNTSAFFPALINKMWGVSSNDFYITGNNGNIAHYNGSSWTRIESGTTSIINDAWGITNQQNNTIVYCAVSSFFVPGDKKILKIVDGKVEAVNWNRDVRLYSTWTNNENFLYVCGEGVFVNKLGTWEQINLPQVGTNSIRGNEINDIFIDGDSGFISHFNGVNWQIYNGNYLKGYSRLSFKNDIVAIAGNYQGKAIVEIGRRN